MNQHARTITALPHGEAGLEGHETPQLRSVQAPTGALVRRVGVFAVCGVILALFGLAAFQAMIVEQQGRLDSVEAQVSEAAELNLSLRAQLTEQASPRRIADYAQNQLGMVPVEPSEITFLTADAPASASGSDPVGLVPLSAAPSGIALSEVDAG